jgi:misacylated tRNA(Ala) deacylase
MNEPYYLRDPYMREADATVASVGQGKFIILDRTLFYPNAGGQPFDTGTITRASDGEAFGVVFVGKFSGDISHEVDRPGLREGDRVGLSLDWPRRYALMRYHTAAHILSGVIHKETGALFTGNQLSVDRARLDLSLEGFDKAKLPEYEAASNGIIGKALPIEFRFLSRQEVERDAGLVRLAKGMDPSIREFRIVDIVGFDAQACGGCHVRNTSEVGRILITGFENKGARNKRIHFVLEGPSG